MIENPSHKGKRYAQAAARLRVPSGFLVATVFVVFSHPTPAGLEVGLPLAFAGLLLRAWAAGHLAKNEALATTGPFAYMRNPLYLGTLTVAAGFGVAGRNAWLAVLFAVYFALVYWPAIGEEESHLRDLFPDYAAYATHVPRLLPRLSPAYPTGRFRREFYLRNREYQALAGYGAGTALLLGKMLLS